ILLQAIGDAGVGIPVPHLSFGTYEQAISPGWFGDPWTVTLPDGTIGVEWEASIPIMDAVDQFLSCYRTFKEYKDKLKLVAPFILLTPIADLLQASWDAIHQQFMTKVKQGLTSLIATLMVSIANDLTGEEMTVEDYADLSSATL